MSLILCGTKCDLPSAVTEAEVAALCADVKAEHVLTSARLDEGIEEAFVLLCAKMVRNHSVGAALGRGPGGARGAKAGAAGNRVKLDDIGDDKLAADGNGGCSC